MATTVRHKGPMPIKAAEPTEEELRQIGVRITPSDRSIPLPSVPSAPKILSESPPARSGSELPSKDGCLVNDLTSIVDIKKVLSMGSSNGKNSMPSSIAPSVILDRWDDSWLKEPKYKECYRKSTKSASRNFERFFLAQELNTTDTVGPLSPTSTQSDSTRRNAIWNMQFSLDGKYLAAAGDDGVIRVWQVYSSVMDRHTEEDKLKGGLISPSNVSYVEDEDQSEVPHKKEKKRKKREDYAPVFKSRPIREFQSHTDTVNCLDWSKNNFLLSGSQDNTIKLWHVDRDECLATFVTKDVVTSVKFMPTDDRFFISGGLDCRVLLWSVQENEIVYKREIPELITVLEFSTNADEIYVGCYNGCCFVLSVTGLDVNAQFEVKKKKMTPKITGMQSLQAPDGDRKLLITSDDSRVRLFGYNRGKLEVRYKGFQNHHSSIKAAASDDMKYIVSGSEDGWVYIWSLKLDELRDNTLAEKDKSFTRPWFSNGLKSIFGDEDCLFKNKNYTAFRMFQSRCNVAIFAPTSTSKLLELSNDPLFDLFNAFSAQKQRDSLELASSIIVTTDNHGTIRVYRRDFAYSVRKPLLSKKTNVQFSLDPTETSTLYSTKSTRNGTETSSLNRACSQLSAAAISRGRSHTSNSTMRIQSLSPNMRMEHESYFSPLSTKVFNSGDYQPSRDSEAQQDNHSNHTLPSQESGGLTCTGCGGDKFSAKSITERGDNKIHFYCDHCGLRLKLD